MERKEYNKLVKEYGRELANKAVAWFIANTKPAFRKHYHQARMCIANEYLWR